MTAKNKTAAAPPPDLDPAINDDGKDTKRIRISHIREDEIRAIPSRSHPDDAGLDLTVSRYAEVGAGAKVLLAHNFGIAIPDGYFGQIVPRSSAMHQLGLVVQTGTIDSGYRGEVQTLVFNPTNKRVPVQEGMRISQLLILPVVAVEFVRSDKLPPSATRGEKGFGSTGGFGKDGPA